MSARSEPRQAEAVRPNSEERSPFATGDELQTYYGPPSKLGAQKDMRRLDRHARDFIARSPFLVVSTVSPDGWPEASPRGDAPGFVAVDGDDRVLIPDRPGNNRLHSLHNVLADGRVGVLFLVPQITHSLRVHGWGRISIDPGLCERFAVRGKPARSVLEVRVELAYFHCGKALIRSQLWNGAAWPSTDGLASLGRILADEIAGVGFDEADALVLKSERERLY